MITENINYTDITEAIHSRKAVDGLTHTFYKYPARFSPQFANSIIEAFTEPGDIVMDPFMGGGTTIVEALSIGRRAIGLDINSLAHFITRAKTTVMRKSELQEIEAWGFRLLDEVNLHNPVERPTEWIEKGYQRNISGKAMWPIRKALELVLSYINNLPKSGQQTFARCVLLKTAQWALDSGTDIPPVNEFRKQFLLNLKEMLISAHEFANYVKKAHSQKLIKQLICLNRSVVGIESDKRIVKSPPPKLILTSPPYPGVHILYHRWQIQSRKETPVPYWIANSLDGHGASYYTFGERKQKHLNDYFESQYKCFKSLAMISAPSTLLVQMVAFSDSSWQLQRYLSTMREAGFAEVKFPALANSPDGRCWRSVPNRKWYATYQDNTESGKEVVLFHRVP